MTMIFHSKPYVRRLFFEHKDTIFLSADKIFEEKNVTLPYVSTQAVSHSKSNIRHMLKKRCRRED